MEDYQTNASEQAMVEICVTRVPAALCGIETHVQTLLGFWASCLEHELCPAAGRDQDTPHVNITSGVMSCILQHYGHRQVMALAVPVAVRFLQWGSGELVRTMSNSLSLATMSQAKLLEEHTEVIVGSIMQGGLLLGNSSSPAVVSESHSMTSPSDF
ncbi:LOW QUALITY PROTEIN: ventricular zone-expressed PH domain-containing protein homolog 1 [Sorex fumeus]|uniref:LOW QUALITY PROTEIN: ventricular zone-expressed PH domain-containing protein homolog 1 n=1 Tax=Sorex fumeus TaxID=62283 RepID=UPI0024AE09F4|nr:LOW QUALITY PROTEIN: ventricular zone-expressed PH domain-containing protein homolog 1 [Sorex fumeus]